MPLPVNPLAPVNNPSTPTSPAPTTPTAKPSAPKQQVTINRNDTSWVFETQNFLKGDRKEAGDVYLGPVKPSLKTPEEQQAALIDLAKFTGFDFAFAQVYAKLSQKAQNWYDEASTSEDGKALESVNLEEFTQYATNFEARGESIKDLTDQRMALIEEMETLDIDKPEDAKRYKAIMVEAKNIKIAIKSKRRMTKEEKEAQKAALAAESK